MKKKIISVLCVVSLLFSAILSVPFSAFAEEEYDFVDDYSSWTQGISKVGSWDLFPNHPDTGLSVAGRQLTDSENSLIYSFDGKKIIDFKLDIAEHSSFYQSSDVSIEAFSNGIWQTVSLISGQETDIEGASQPLFKSLEISPSSIPENTTKIKISLNNVVGWTTFLDRLSLKTEDYTPTTDVFQSDSYVDNFDSDITMAQKTGNFICSNPHSEMGISVYTRADTTSESSLTYTFKGKKITSVCVDVAEATGFFAADDLIVSAYSDGVWNNLALTRGNETVIPTATVETFKNMSVTPDSIPENTTKIKITLNNSTAWTLHLDKVTFELADLEISSDEKYIDDFSSFDTVSKKSGSWNCFNPNTEFGESVFGRNDVSGENIIYYYFGEKSITKLDVDIVLYHGFFSDSDITISVSGNGKDYISVATSISSESDIEGYETVNFKAAKITSEEIPDNAHWLAIALKNAVNYTLFLDKLTVYGVSEVCPLYNEKTLYFTNSSGTTLEYYLTTPVNYDCTTALPLVVLMHGLGGDVDRTGYTFLRDKLIEQNKECILLAPIADSTKNQYWIDFNSVSAVGSTAIYNQDDLTPTPALLAARDLIKTINNTYNVDNSRVYALGISMGGFATYELATRYPELFSAIAPICGGCDPTKAEVVKDLPVWSFHGDADATVNVDADRAMASALVIAGNSEAIYTEYEGLDHGIWFEAMGNSGLISWMFDIENETNYSENTKYEFDYLTDWNIASNHTDGYTFFANQPDIKDSVLTATDSNYGENYIEYNFENKEITEVAVDTGFHSDYANAEFLLLKAKTLGSEEWHTVKATTVLNTPVAESQYVVSTLSFKGLPRNTVSVRISVKSDAVNWTYLINNVSIKHKEEIKVYDFETGDINKDTFVNIIDLVSMKKQIAATTQNIFLDVDGDNKINSRDISVLIKHLLGITQLDNQEKIEKLRKASLLKEFADNDLIFLAGAQLSNGAYPTYNGTAGSESINPYFCDYIAMALLNRSDLYAANVKNYIDWHFAHLNNDGTIYDYYMEGDTEKTNATYDSTDSYAATFLMLLDKYLEKTDETTYISEHSAEIEKIYNAMISTLNGNLTYAKPDYQIIYTMDNSEVYKGLLSAEKLFDALGKNELALQTETNAVALKRALEEKLLNENGYYESGIDLEGNVAVPYVINEYYPSGSAQLFPIIFNLVDNDKKMNIYNNAKRIFDSSSIAVKEDYFAFVALAAASVGDADYLLKYKDSFTNTVVLSTSINPYVAVALEAAYTYINSIG